MLMILSTNIYLVNKKLFTFAATIIYYEGSRQTTKYPEQRIFWIQKEYAYTPVYVKLDEIKDDLKSFDDIIKIF